MATKFRTTLATLIMPVLLGGYQATAQTAPLESLPDSLPSQSTSSSVTEVADLTAPPIRSAVLPSAMYGGAGVQLPPPPPRTRSRESRPVSGVALGLTASTLGAGIELAKPIARAFNVRVGGSYINAAYPFSVDGVDYSAGMKLTSGQATIDWFPTRGGFHLSAGALYLRNAINASADVAPGQPFKLGDSSYLNSVDDPIHGSASFSFAHKIAPVMLVGFGNLIPRSGRHFSLPVEVGGAFLGQPHVGMQLAGTACTSEGCFDASTDPTVQSDLKQEQDKLNADLRPFQFFPIVSIGFGFRF